MAGRFFIGASAAQGQGKYQYQVARRMLTMTRDINSNWQAHVGQTGVTCHTCHRGQPVPPYVWFVDPGSGRENAFVGTRAGQNSAVTGLGITTIGHSSLPYDPYSPYLLGNLPIRVNGPTALPTGNRSSIKQAEWTYALMVHMSESLGVNCTYCHNSRAFAEWGGESRPQRTTAWHGIRMARGLNNTYMVPLTLRSTVRRQASESIWVTGPMVSDPPAQCTTPCSPPFHATAASMRPAT